VLSKEEAMHMGFLLLEHAGAKVRPAHPEATPPADHTVAPGPDQTS
jgi:hypothetical protein